jgi:PadR family transcriptional regulator AphA
MAPRENKTKYAILGMLSFEPKSGYEISKAIQNSTAFFWSESDGQLYPILKRLHEEGLVTFIESNSEEGRSKKVYTLTEDGHTALQDWLKQEPTTFNIRNEFLLQLFFGHNIDDAENIHKIKELQQKLKRQLKLFGGIEAGIKARSTNPRYLLLSLSYGQAGLQAEIDWCDKAIKILESK